MAAPLGKARSGAADEFDKIGNGKGVAGSGYDKNTSAKITDNTTRVATGIFTLGASEIGGDKGFGSKVGKAAGNIDRKTWDFFKKLDPTNTKIERADQSGVVAAQEGVQGVAGRASSLAADLGKKPVKAQVVQTPTGMTGSTVERQGPIVADVVRGSAQQVQAGQAQAGSMDAAQIADVERMQAAGLSREDAELRVRQMALADTLAASAAGEGPSLAQSQLNRANDQAVSTQMALAASARGGNPVLAQRQAAQNVAAIQQDNAAKSAELRLAEALQARGQLGQVLDSARGQDISVAGTQAGFDQQANLANATAANNRATAQAGLTQDASKTNALEAGQTSRFNVEQTLRSDLANQDVDLRAALADQGANLTAQTATAQNNLTADTFNAKAADEMARFQADAGLRASIANQAAQLQAQGMTIDGIAKMMGIEQQSLAAVLTSETEKVKAEQAILTAEKSNQSNMGGSILSTAGTIVAMCFPRGEQVLMADGSTKNIESLNVGDELYASRVVEIRGYFSHEALYRFGNATATGSHAVWTGEGWASFAEVGVCVGEPAERAVYTVVTSTGVMIVGDALVGDDEHDADDLNAMERRVA